MIRQSGVYRTVCLLQIPVFVVIGGLCLDAASAYGGRNATERFDSDFDYAVEMSQRWLLGVAGSEPVIADVNLTPDGGYFELPGGLVLDAPPGAVSEPTLFQIRLLTAEEVEPYLDIGETKKGFLGGFEATCDGVAFNVPVWVQFPVQPLPDPNCLPYLFHLDEEKGTLVPDLAEETFPAAPEAPAIRVAGSTASGYMYDPRDSFAGMALRNLPPGRRSQVLTAVYDMLGDNDCVANPCRCLGKRITEGAADLVSDKCSKTSISGSVQFADCLGQPTETWNMEEQSLQIAVKMSPNRRAIRCKESLTMTVTVFDLDGEQQNDYEVKVTNSRPDLLEVTDFGGGVYTLDRVGDETGVANVVIDAGCGITRTIPIQVGCEIPALTGKWVVNGTETWWGCQDPEDDGVYAGPYTIKFDSQVRLTPTRSKFGGTFKYEEHTEDYTLYYTENYAGEISVDCDVTDRCTYKVSGHTDYTEKYYFPDSEPDDPPYIIKGMDTFSGNYSNGVMRLTTLGLDTEGDTCQSAGTMVLRH